VRPLKASFALNLLSPLFRVAVAFVTTPIYLHHVGEARFGVISIVWILLGLFGFMDLGLSRAATNALRGFETLRKQSVRACCSRR
jgi:O-antigen/teichoic acid export membrane protein